MKNFLWYTNHELNVFVAAGFPLKVKAEEGVVVTDEDLPPNKLPDDAPKREGLEVDVFPKSEVFTAVDPNVFVAGLLPNKPLVEFPNNPPLATGLFPNKDPEFAVLNIY